MLERNDSILLVDKEVERQLKIYHTLITIKPFLSSSFLWIIGVSNLLKKRPPPSLIISHGYIKRNGNLKAPPFPTSSHTFATHSSLAMAIGNNLSKTSLTISHHHLPIQNYILWPLPTINPIQLSKTSHPLLIAFHKHTLYFPSSLLSDFPSLLHKRW